jgi:hypothetical protein
MYFCTPILARKVAKKETNKAIYHEENIPTLNEEKSQQARFPQENVYRQR